MTSRGDDFLYVMPALAEVTVNRHHIALQIMLDIGHFLSRESVTTIREYESEYSVKCANWLQSYLALQHTPWTSNSYNFTTFLHIFQLRYDGPSAVSGGVNLVHPIRYPSPSTFFRPHFQDMWATNLRTCFTEGHWYMYRSQPQSFPQHSSMEYT